MFGSVTAKHGGTGFKTVDKEAAAHANDCSARRKNVVLRSCRRSLVAQSLSKNVFYLIEEARGPVGGLVFDSQSLAKLFQRAALIAGELRRDDHAYVDVKVAAAAMGIRKALSLLAENLSGLRAFGNLEFGFALQRGNLDLRAECGLGKADWDRAIEVCAATLEERVLLHFEENIQIACGTAVGSGLALAGHAQASAGIDSGGHANFQRAFAFDPRLAAAGLASLADHLSRTLARRARARD